MKIVGGRGGGLNELLRSKDPCLSRDKADRFDRKEKPRRIDVRCDVHFSPLDIYPTGSHVSHQIALGIIGYPLGNLPTGYTTHNGMSHEIMGLSHEIMGLVHDVSWDIPRDNGISHGIYWDPWDKLSNAHRGGWGRG